ncbi:MAG: FtsX-like permease family protein [Candidatus Heimdallarchaeota archaeon]
MGTTESDSRKKSLFDLFRIFIKTSRNRVILTLICGMLIFTLITCFSLFAYNYRYNFYNQYIDENENWLNDGFVSVASSDYYHGNISFTDNFMENMTEEFSSIVMDYFPNIEATNSTSTLSVQLYSPPHSPWVPDPDSNKLLTMDDASYSIFNASLIVGRLPVNSSEIALLRGGNTIHYVNDSITLFGSEYMITGQSFKIVGLIEIDELTFLDAGISLDNLNYNFKSETRFFDYYELETFITNFTMFQEIVTPYTYYSGMVEYLVDLEFDCDAIRISKLNEYLLNLPRETTLPISSLIEYYVLPCDDLNILFLGFIDSWITETIQLMALNIPLLLIIGITTGGILNIGAKNLESAYRRMKLHGLSYNNMRSMILLENSSFSFLSLLGGVSFGIGINYLVIANLPNLPPNFFVDFLLEPILLMLIGIFFLGFFFISYFTQTTIAKKASETISEEFKIKRTKFKNLFSTNEFRLFVISLVFALISIILYFLFRDPDSPSVVSSNISYVTIFWFFVACSIALILIFLLLLIARLITLLWSLINKITWKKNINFGSLSIKHLTVSKKTYQLALLTALVFGMLVLPTVGINYSIKQNLMSEANLNIGASSLAVVDWVDPENKRDYVFDAIDEIEKYTEVSYYQVINYYSSSLEPAITLNLIGIENSSEFLEVINYDLMKDRSWTDNDVLSLETPGALLVDKKTSRKLDFKPGNDYYTNQFTRHYSNFSIIHSYNYFPCAPLPKKSIFDTSRVVYTFIGNVATIKSITSDLSFAVGVRTMHYKLIKPVNESSIPIIREKLENSSVIRNDKIYELNDMYNELYLNLNTYTKNNLLFYSVLIFFVLAFIGYFTGLNVFDERVRVIEVLYRVGAEREKILSIFLMESCLINLVPLLVAMLISLPLIRVVELFVIGLQEVYYPFKHGIPFWLFLVLFLSGIIASTIGWLISMIPQIYRYKPVKQE